MTRLIWNLGIFAAVVAAYLSGLLQPLDHAATSLRFDFLKRDTSRSLVVVEIDARSLKELNRWPWPRGYHASVIDRLHEAGAAAVGIDIDLSSRSSPSEDVKLLAALSRTRGSIVLPAFSQVQVDAAGKSVLIHTEPLPEFSALARRAVVNVRVDRDGRVRRYSESDIWKGIEIESFAMALSGDSGSRRQRGEFGIDFGIDFGIELANLPRLSYVDVLRGEFDPSAVAGKTVMIGATAVELGDSVPVPVYSVIPGVMLQALAYETLVQGRALKEVPAIVIVVLVFVLTFGLGCKFVRRSWRRGLAISTAAAVGLFGASLAVQGSFPLTIDVMPLILATVLSYGAGLWHVIDSQALAIFRQRATALHRRAMMESVVSDSFDGIVICDQSGRVELLNPAAETMLNCRSEDVVGGWIDAIIPGGGDAIRDIASAPGTGEELVALRAAAPQEIIVRSQSGKENSESNDALVIELVVSSSRLSLTHQRRRHALDKTFHVFTFRNVTERWRTEKARQNALEEYAAANRAKTEFIANIGHELRTPLNAIIGFSELIKNETFGSIGSQRYLDYTSDIHGSGVHLLAIVNDILDISKIESGEMQLSESPISLESILTSAAKALQDQVGARDLGIFVDCQANLPRLFGDERRLRQILDNLLSNAVKFTPDPGQVTLRCRVDGDGALSLSIEDTGIGIAEEDIDKALQSFGQVDGRLQRHYEGTGLGLSVVSGLARLHDAEFSLASELGVGTVASIRFPKARVIHRTRDNHSETPRYAAKS